MVVGAPLPAPLILSGGGKRRKGRVRTGSTRACVGVCVQSLMPPECEDGEVGRRV